mmetsp:Transcript_25852/g.39112  ORF Transcript_25852/g.39112 Transcript_25852/m.39112 type:complete len:158 (+) Transcript_25852:380-853(+)|eukprot:CAMPEP_0178901272 /NCGR_PEP_ID=MMETSP0786-20121207/3929_1 /TAXON_ID=186022 /ORGANISM="Thalassionema frauenfeldii, Strain CCMP 1798" /LENGTH=157 /DNA_ID=CAMNT_0020572353 /DNA_START=260 /DNA_END=733 /DNA_ORIENTATION=-
MSEFSDFYRLLSELSCADNGLYVGDDRFNASNNELSLLSEDDYDTLFLPPPLSINSIRRKTCHDDDSMSDDTSSVDTTTKAAATSKHQSIEKGSIQNEISARRMSRRMSILESNKDEFRRIKAELSKSGMTIDREMANNVLKQSPEVENLAACKEML